MSIAPSLATPYEPRAPSYDDLTVMSITGMRDNPDPSAANPRKAYNLQNVYPGDPEVGGGLVGRPGLQQLGAQGGASGARRGQRTVEFVKKDGTRYRVRFIGGVMQTLDWPTRTWTTVTLDAAITLDDEAMIFTAFFADVLVVSDGVNTPWTFDGTTTAELTGVPVFYGPMTVHNGTLMGIKAADRIRFVWSDVGDPTSGYDMVGSDQFWDFYQTSTAPLNLLIGTNSGLYVLRDNSTELVLGDEVTGYEAASTLSGVSLTIGTSSCHYAISGDYIWTLDSDGHPQVLQIGGKYIEEMPPWEDAKKTLERIPKDKLGLALVVDYSPANLILYGIAGLGADDPDRIVAFDAHRKEFVGIWKWGQFEPFTALDMITNAEKQKVLVHLGTDGYSYDHGNPDGALWSDALAGGTVAIDHVVEGTAQGYHPRYERDFLQVDVSLRLSSTMTDFRLGYTTPYGTAADQTVASIAGGFAVWGGSTWGGTVWGAGQAEKHQAVGISGYGRWIRIRIRHGGLGEQFGLLGWTVEASPVPSSPRAR